MTQNFNLNEQEKERFKLAAAPAPSCKVTGIEQQFGAQRAPGETQSDSSEPKILCAELPVPVELAPTRPRLSRCPSVRGRFGR